MSKTCRQTYYSRRAGRTITAYRPHDVPWAGTGDPNDGYAICSHCGAEVYVGSGLHPNLGVPMDEVDAEIRYLRSQRG